MWPHFQLPVDKFNSKIQKSRTHENLLSNEREYSKDIDNSKDQKYMIS